jgi:hypothetical protein
MTPVPAPSQDTSSAENGRLALMTIPAHRRVLGPEDEQYAVPAATRALYPGSTQFSRRYKAWYVIGRGLDFGIFYDYWYVMLKYGIHSSRLIFFQGQRQSAHRASQETWREVGATRG